MSPHSTPTISSGRRALASELWAYGRLGTSPADRVRIRYHAARLLDVRISAGQVRAALEAWLSDLSSRPEDFFVRLDLRSVARRISALPT